jgi:hypothetical protein
MLPVILGIAASAVSTALTTGQALAIGTGIGVVSANLLKNNKERQQREGDVPDDDELDELVELLEERLLRRKKKKG